jgi:6-phosphogluconate dehydrogenase (decarboxylating)
MPGGSPPAWEHIKPIFQKIAARAPDGAPCCEWMGENGAGHFVKMVHNGIEYGDMQMICETYEIMKEGLGMSNEEMHEVFAEWDKEELDSYLIEITADILKVKDDEGNYVIDLILDTAGQKGTGKWTVVEALDQGQPLTLIAEAVFARCLSALKDERVDASKELQGPKAAFRGKPQNLLTDLRFALYASKIVSYAQGFMLMRAAAKEHKWNLNYGAIASIWRQLHHPLSLPARSRPSTGGPICRTCCSTVLRGDDKARRVAACGHDGGQAGHPVPAIGARRPSTTAIVISSPANLPRPARLRQRPPPGRWTTARQFFLNWTAAVPPRRLNVTVGRRNAG